MSKRRPRKRRDVHTPPPPPSRPRAHPKQPAPIPPTVPPGSGAVLAQLVLTDHRTGQLALHINPQLSPTQIPALCQGALQLFQEAQARALSQSHVAIQVPGQPPHLVRRE